MRHLWNDVAWVSYRLVMVILSHGTGAHVTPLSTTCLKCNSTLKRGHSLELTTISALAVFWTESEFKIHGIESSSLPRPIEIPLSGVAILIADVLNPARAEFAAQRV